MLSRGLGLGLLLVFALFGMTGCGEAKKEEQQPRNAPLKLFPQKKE